MQPFAFRNDLAFSIFAPKRIRDLFDIMVSYAFVCIFSQGLCFHFLTATDFEAFLRGLMIIFSKFVFLSCSLVRPVKSTFVKGIAG